MQRFKNRWEITQNWQLIFPLIGVLAVVYSAYRLSQVVLKDTTIYVLILSTLALSWLLIKFFLFLFKKLETKWILDAKWEMIRVFLVFAITGSSSVLVGKPILKFIGISKENLNETLYWILYIIFGLIIYQVLLVSLGWLFGQFQFFWSFEKKMLSRMGFKRFFK